MSASLPPGVTQRQLDEAYEGRPPRRRPLAGDDSGVGMDWHEDVATEEESEMERDRR